jgi:hypothetical protein
MEKLRIRKFLTDKKLNGHKIYIDTFNNSVKCYDLEKLILEYVNKNTPKIMGKNYFNPCPCCNKPRNLFERRQK